MDEKTTILDNFHNGTESYIYHLITNLQYIKYAKYFDIRKWLKMEINHDLNDRSHLLDCYRGEKAKIKVSGEYQDVVILETYKKNDTMYKLILKIDNDEIVEDEIEAEKIIICI